MLPRISSVELSGGPGGGVLRLVHSLGTINRPSSCAWEVSIRSR